MTEKKHANTHTQCPTHLSARKAEKKLAEWRSAAAGRRREEERGRESGGLRKLK